MNNHIQKLYQFYDYFSILITAYNEISELMLDIIKEYLILYFKTFNTLLYDFLKYSRTIKELILNSRFNFRYIF
jgi:hypothetical protein